MVRIPLAYLGAWQSRRLPIQSWLCPLLRGNNVLKSDSSASVTGATSGGGKEICASALKSQKSVTNAVGAVEPLSVLWLTHSDSIPVAEQCKLLAELQAEYPWVQAGTDFFDGSHVTC